MIGQLAASARIAVRSAARIARETRAAFGSITEPEWRSMRDDKSRRIRGECRRECLEDVTAFAAERAGEPKANAKNRR
jgi:hypothetical protein